MKKNGGKKKSGVKKIIIKVEKKKWSKNKKWIEEKAAVKIKSRLKKKMGVKKNWEKVRVKKNVIKKFKKSGGQN